ncbi:uncharacterized protein LOC124282776 [Haliotis rubra]|uniref:uncharacterized protein LOC124282776 n=1 Tax=Haliotis rubra TaxID=36100 RepID=UPI001EE55961|nr:uncharacterized protein LOC124282776 [Haliotis rubra]
MKDLKKDPDIAKVTADKRRAMVILDKSEFHSLVNKMLTDPTTYRKLKKDPTSTLQRQHKSTLKRMKDTFEITAQPYYELSVSHPQHPYARATIKSHKDLIKARLLVCSRDTVFYNTTQYLAEILSPLGKTAKSYITDSTDFCQTISSITEPDQIISYDVVDLFTNFPPTKPYKSSVSASPTWIDLSIDSIISLTKSCITSTYFTWGDNIFEQIHGLPFSPIRTEIYMTHFEEETLASFPIQPVCLYRKVDDTFVILGKDQHPTSLHQHLNTQHPRIKFTMETENDNKLPFHNVLVSRDPCDTIQTKVYRTPTHSDQYIHFYFNHPPKTKFDVISPRIFAPAAMT